MGEVEPLTPEEGRCVGCWRHKSGALYFDPACPVHGDAARATPEGDLDEFGNPSRVDAASHDAYRCCYEHWPVSSPIPSGSDLTAALRATQAAFNALWSNGPVIDTISDWGRDWTHDPDPTFYDLLNDCRKAVDAALSTSSASSPGAPE